MLVVTLLGVVMMMALPRYLARETGAESGYLQRIAGDLETNAALYHAQWVAAGRPAVNTALATFGGLRSNAAGYPYGVDDPGLGSAGLSSADDCAVLFRGLLGSSAPSVIAAPRLQALGVQRAEFTALMDGEECHFFLTRDGVAEELPVLRYDAGRGRTALEHRMILKPS